MSRGAVDELRAAGHDVVWVCEWPQDPGDRAILDRAFEQGRTVVTQDKDFGALAVFHRVPHAGIIRIVEDSVWVHAAMCEKALAAHGEALTAGAIVVVEQSRTRVWISGGGDAEDA
jgi:predicted nuclease of predicted toxin-antitoxin system